MVGKPHVESALNVRGQPTRETDAAPKQARSIAERIQAAAESDPGTILLRLERRSAGRRA